MGIARWSRYFVARGRFPVGGSAGFGALQLLQLAIVNMVIAFLDCGCFSHTLLSTKKTAKRKASIQERRCTI
mgnify:CR=1 FL=1